MGSNGTPHRQISRQSPYCDPGWGTDYNGGGVDADTGAAYVFKKIGKGPGPH